MTVHVMHDARGAWKGPWGRRWRGRWAPGRRLEDWLFVWP